jgi:hypothetical protein
MTAQTIEPDEFDSSEFGEPSLRCGALKVRDRTERPRRQEA